MRTARTLAVSLLLAAGSVAVGLPAAPAPIVVTTQILDYERGFVFFTSGDGFRVSPQVVVDTMTGKPASHPPQARDYARVTFSADGLVTRIDLSAKPLPPQGNLADVERFALAASPTVPNPELAQAPGGPGCQGTGGHRVKVTFVVQVPPSTPLTDTVFMTTDQSGWNPQAYKMDRIDALHFRTELTFNSGTDLRYLFDRGSAASIEVGENGLDQPPYRLCIGAATVQAESIKVYHWADQIGNGVNQVPLALPTPYNPAPFPNLPPR